jgi:hypothetical protein
MSNIVKAFDFNNESIYRRTSDNYWNATAMCKAGGKRIDHFFENKWSKSYIEQVSTITGIKGNELVQTIKGGNPYEQGTWVHEIVAIRIAQWLSPEFAAKVDLTLYQLKQQYQQSHQLLLEQESANVHGIPIAPRNEVDLAFRIKNWIDLCTDGGRFYIEHPLINTINATTKTRRVDFVKSNGRNVIVYELKLNKITTSDIAKTIGDKGYYQLCADKFNRPIKFIFLSPLGITNEAQLLLDRMNDVSFLTTQQLCQEYYVKGKKNKWRSSEWYLDVQVKDDKFSHLFTDEFINDVTVKLTKVK